MAWITYPLQSTIVRHIAPGAIATSPTPIPTRISLVQAILGMAGSAPTNPLIIRALAWSDSSDGWSAEDLSEAIKQTRELEQRLKSEIARRNATPHSEDTFMRWWQDERINPIKFYTLVLMFAAGLPGKRPPLAKARAHALLLLRPDLFCRHGVIWPPNDTPSKNLKENTNPLVGQMCKERHALDKKLKVMMEKPPSGLASIIARIRKDWETAMNAQCLEFGVSPTPDALRIIMAEYCAKVRRTH